MENIVKKPTQTYAFRNHLSHHHQVHRHSVFQSVNATRKCSFWHQRRSLRLRYIPPYRRRAPGCLRSRSPRAASRPVRRRPARRARGPRPPRRRPPWACWTAARPPAPAPATAGSTPASLPHGRHCDRLHDYLCDSRRTVQIQRYGRSLDRDHDA